MGWQQPLGHCLHGEECGQQRGHVHAVLRQILRLEKETLQCQPGSQADGCGRCTQDQEQRRAQDQVHLGHAHGRMREHLEENEHQQRGERTAQQQRDRPFLAHVVERQLGGVERAGARSGIGQHDLGTVDNSGFHVHGGAP